jgi:hypothetical protein
MAAGVGIDIDVIEGNDGRPASPPKSFSYWAL